MTEHQRIFDQEIKDLKETIKRMGEMVQDLIRRAVESLQAQDQSAAKRVIEDDEKIDKLELVINEKCVQLIALRQPEASDLRFILTGMRIANELERIGDLAGDIAERTVELAGQTLPKPLIDIPKMAKLTQESVALAIEAFIKGDPVKAKAIWEWEDEVDKLRDAVHDELLTVMSRDPKTIPQAVALLLVSRHLERISDHSTNIAEDVVYMVEARVVKHGGGQ